MILLLLLTLGQHDHSTHQEPGHTCLLGGLEDAGPHMKRTRLREPNAAGERRAAEIVTSLKNTLKKYADHEAALKDGYRIFLPRLPLPEHHFTNYAYAAREGFEFDVERPSSLLYRKKGSDYELLGAMFTAPLGASLEELNRRIPLSAAQWHVHTNVCFPPKGKGIEMLRRNPRFGFSQQATIASEAECADEGGRFYHAVFGYMVHVYPFEDDPAAIWKHPDHHDHGMGEGDSRR